MTRMEAQLASPLRRQRLLQIENRPCRSGGPEGSNNVRTVTIVSVQTRAVVIIHASGDETLVVIIPILG
jgi:hypothetical protein